MSGDSAEVSKLFVGVDVPPMNDSMYSTVTERQEHPHMTFQYCGGKLTKSEREAIIATWNLSLPWEGMTMDELWVEVLPEFALFGKDNDTVVVKCKVSDALRDAVNKAIAATGIKSDFGFTPHITLGMGATLPDIKQLAETHNRFIISTVKFWGDEYKVLDTINIVRGAKV